MKEAKRNSKQGATWSRLIAGEIRLSGGKEIETSEARLVMLTASEKGEF
jgi:hypothetical protein